MSHTMGDSPDNIHAGTKTLQEIADEVEQLRASGQHTAFDAPVEDDDAPVRSAAPDAQAQVDEDVDPNAGADTREAHTTDGDTALHGDAKDVPMGAYQRIANQNSPGV